MKRFLYISAVLFCHVAFAELEVEWIDENTIRVWGTGDGGSQTVVTNWLGCCTNCTLITPEELTSGMDSIISKCSDILYISSNIDLYVSSCLADLDYKLDDISTFRRFGDSPSAYLSTSEAREMTNYISTVENAQTSLDRQYLPTLSLSQYRNALSAYNNGIYDYANDSVKPFLNISVRSNYNFIKNLNSQILPQATAISSIAEQYRNLSNCPCGDDAGGGGDSGGGSCAWTAEQVRELLGYVDHIDQDQHKRFIQLDTMSNSVVNIYHRMDSYAKLVSGVLYQDGTIVVDDGENSWSNVYQRGYSDLYDYDKSNILQRIELLLFGISYNTSTNWGDSVESFDDTSDELVEKFSQAEDTLREQSESLKDDVELIEEKFTTFVNRLNFFGAGHLGEFSLIDPLTVFDVYTFDVDTAGFASDLGNLQQVSRTCFQIFYWVSAVLFMVWFWWSFIRFVINHVFTLVKFFNNLLT